MNIKKKKLKVKKNLIRKLVDGIQDNDKFNYNSESSKTKPSS